LPAAEADYQAALAWYLGRSPQAAAGFEAAVEVALRAIGSAPERWTTCDDRHRFYVLPRYPYSNRIIYRVEAAGPLVVAFAHSSQSAASWQGRG
jgi:plasmid stabilization system protein ParE